MRVFLIVFVILLVTASCKNKKESAEFFTRGNFHFKKKEYDKAEHFFSEAIKKNPELADAYNNRGLIHLHRGELTLAQEDFEKAVNLDKSFTDAHYNLAKLYTEIGEVDAGERLFKDIEQKLDTSSAFHNAYGQNFIFRNKFPEGESHFVKALSLDAKNVEALTNLAYVKTVNHSYNEANDLVDKALSIQPDFVYALNNKAVLLGKERKFSEGIALLEKAERLEPNNQILVNNMALYLLENGQLEAGKAKVKRALKISDKNEYTKRNEGILLLKQGKAHESLQVFIEVEKDFPEVDYIYYYLGQAYDALGDKVNACKNYKIAQGLKDVWSKGKCQ